MKTNRKKLISIYKPIICMCLMCPLSAQKASIKGQIVNGEDQTPIHGADVYLGKLSLGATSQVDGHFTLNDIPFGEVTIRVSMIGFKDVDRSFILEK